MMKLVIFIGLFAVAFGLTPQYDQRLVTPGQIIPILRLENQISPEGSYHYAYETGNGIAAEESGQLRAVGNVPGAEGGTVAQGSYQYTSPEGLPVQISYVADENGYQPTGNVLPTSPPIPPAILRSLEYIAAHPEPQQATYSQAPQYYTTQRPYQF